MDKTLDQPLQSPKQRQYDGPKSFNDLFDEFLSRQSITETSPGGRVLTFDTKDKIIVGSISAILRDFGYGADAIEKSIDHITVYNPTAPFMLGKKRCMFARVEPKEVEYSISVLFEESEDGAGFPIWRPVQGAPIFKQLQDPFYLGKVGGSYLFGGVEISIAEEGKVPYRTVLFKFEHIDGGDIISELAGAKRFAAGSWGMKGVRLCQLPDGKIAVFKRPQGGIAGLGKMTYGQISSLAELQDELGKEIAEEDIIAGMFLEDEWGGPNQLFVLGNGLVCILGHIARFDDKQRKDYAAAAMIFDPATRTLLDLKMIATSYSFRNITPKHMDLHNILYSGGMVRSGTGKALLYAGIGDTVAGYIEIADPFVEWEKLQ
ncbi:MAG: DUF1861 family protein [Patescibacteria group bacterium]|jgi:hypothetical protein